MAVPAQTGRVPDDSIFARGAIVQKLTPALLATEEGRSRFNKLGREANERRDNGIAVVLMVVDSSCHRFVCVKPFISSQGPCAFSDS
jgi:hypothetical protein